MSYEVAWQHCQENLEPRHVFPLLCASKTTLKRLTANGALRLAHVTSRVALSMLWPDRICHNCIETVVLHSAAPRSFYESLPKLRSVSWCVANPIDALDLPNASPTFMLPNLPRMMFYLDLVRRGKKTFVTLQVERLDRGSRSEVLPLFLSVSLRKHLHDGELDYGGQLNREMEKALTSAKLESLQRHESVAIVFPSESSDGMERFSEMMDATKWEIHFSASRASEDELGCLEVQADTATWKVGNAKKVLDCGGVSSEPFSLTGLRGTWTMDLKSSTVGPVFSLWPPPVHRPIRYELELGPSEAGNRQLAQCSPIPGFEATFPLDLPKLLDSSGSLQMRLRLLRCERSEGFVVFPDGDSCVLMWRLGQVACFLDASSIWSSPVFCIRGTENWEGCLWMESNLDRALLLQLRWPPTRGATPGAPQLSAKVGPSRWMDAREAPGESLVFNFGPFDTLSDSLDPVSDSLLIMLRIHGTSADHLKLRSTA